MTRLPTPLADAFVADIFATFPDRPLSVRFEYNGSGDDGWFDDWTVTFPDDRITGWYTDSVVSGTITTYGGNPIPTEVRNRCDKLREVAKRHDMHKVYNELGGILCGRHPGWEINDGGSGAFVHASDGTRRHEHTTNVMDTIEEENPY
jgi:hypothetical protein